MQHVEDPEDGDSEGVASAALAKRYKQVFASHLSQGSPLVTIQALPIDSNVARVMLNC